MIIFVLIFTFIFIKRYSKTHLDTFTLNDHIHQNTETINQTATLVKEALINDQSMPYYDSDL